MTSKDTPQCPPTTKDATMEQCCCHIKGDVTLLAGALGISDESLKDIQSKFKQTQDQALQMIKMWMAFTGGNTDVLVSILRRSGFGKAAEV